MQAKALFFTEENLITDTEGVPFLSYHKMLESLHPTIEFNYFMEGILAIKCIINLGEDELLAMGYKLCAVKPYLSHLSLELQLPVIKAYHRIQWETQSRFCGKCGHALKIISHTSSEKRCIQCEESFFPRFSPAVIVAIQREHEILLARSPHFPEGVYSALAGFIDLGETAEMAAHREVEEEVGIKITDLEYVGTQPWPFPDSFMIGFKATYLSGELTIDKNELESAQWFSLDNLPKLPGKASIARALIDSTLIAIESGS